MRAILEIARLLEGQEVFRRQLFALLEALEDLLRLSLRVDLFRGGLGNPAALHPDPVDDLVVVVDLPDVLDVLAVLFVREHLRLDELLLGPVRLLPQGVALPSRAGPARSVRPAGSDAGSRRRRGRGPAR